MLPVFFFFFFFSIVLILPTGSLIPRLVTMSSLAEAEKWDYKKKV